MLAARRGVNPVGRPEHRGRDKAAAEPRPPIAEFERDAGGDLTQRKLLSADPCLFSQIPHPQNEPLKESGKHAGKQVPVMSLRISGHLLLHMERIGSLEKSTRR